jgi:asparagine synthase (glutamine-hydrolysing)
MFAMSIVDTLTKSYIPDSILRTSNPYFISVVSKHGIVTASQFDQVFLNTCWFKKVEIALIMKGMLQFGCMQAPNTIYENIYQVNHRLLLKMSSEGRVRNYTFLKNMESSNFD